MFRIVRYLLLALLLVFAFGCSRDPVAQSNRLVESGKKFYDKGKYKEASIMFRRAIQKNPKNGDAYYRLGLTDLKLEDYPDAVRALQRAASTNPNNVDASVKLADIYWTVYLSQRKPEFLEEVKSISQALQKKNPNSFDGLRLDGFVALANNDMATALKKFDAANAAKPYDPGLSAIYAQTLWQAGKADQAEKLLKEIISRQKNFAQGYQQLVLMYLVQKRLPEAEQTLKLMADNNPHSDGPLIQLASFYSSTNRRSDMEATLQRILSNPNDFPMGRRTVGAFFARLREYDRARHEFEEGIKSNPKEKATYQKAIVEILAAQGKNSEASQLIGEIVKDNPKDSQAIAMRSALVLRGGSREEIKQAVADMQKLVAQDPKNAVYRFQYAQALAANNDIEAARLQLEEAIKFGRRDFIAPRLLLARIYTAKRDYAKAQVAADEVLAIDRQNYSARLVRSTALMGLGKRDEARAELQALLKEVPNSTDARFQLGSLSFLEKDYKGAEEIFRELQKTAPGDVRGLYGIIESEVAQKNYQNAINLLEAAIEKEPNREDYRQALAKVLIRDAQYDKAIKTYQDIIAKNPKSAESLFLLGETYRLKGDLNAAIDAFRKSKNVAAPGDTRATLRLAMLLDGLGRRDEAKPMYEEVLRAQPDQPVALNNLAYLKAEEGSDLDTAMSYARKARSSYPQDSNIADTLGWIYIKKNLSDDAIRIYREITSREPNNPVYRYHLAMALLQKGDRQSAKKELETAMKNGPTAADQQKIQALMVKVGL